MRQRQPAHLGRCALRYRRRRAAAEVPPRHRPAGGCRRGSAGQRPDGLAAPPARHAVAVFRHCTLLPAVRAAADRHQQHDRPARHLSAGRAAGRCAGPCPAGRPARAAPGDAGAAGGQRGARLGRNGDADDAGTALPQRRRLPAAHRGFPPHRAVRPPADRRADDDDGAGDRTRAGPLCCRRAGATGLPGPDLGGVDRVRRPHGAGRVRADGGAWPGLARLPAGADARPACGRHPGDGGLRPGRLRAAVRCSTGRRHGRPPGRPPLLGRQRAGSPRAMANRGRAGRAATAVRHPARGTAEPAQPVAPWPRRRGDRELLAADVREPRHDRLPRLPGGAGCAVPLVLAAHRACRAGAVAGRAGGGLLEQLAGAQVDRPGLPGRRHALCRCRRRPLLSLAGSTPAALLAVAAA